MHRLFLQVVFVLAIVAPGHFRSLHGQTNKAPEQVFIPIPATLSVTQNGVIVDGTLFLPEKIGRVHAVIVVIRAVLGQQVYQDPMWRTMSENLRCGLLLAGVGNSEPLAPDRPLKDQAVRNAAVGGGEGLLVLLERMAEQSGHPELKDAKVIVWGQSAAAGFAITFAALYPDRTIAFVRYHSHLRGVPVDLPAAAQVPGLLLAGENDAAAGVEDAEALWKGGRSVNAPWTFAIEPGATHAGSAALKKANDLAIPWITAVFEQRLAAQGKTLRAIDESSGWLANHRTGEIASYGSFSGVRREASWLPDEASARAWLVVTGRLR